jgi:hypothetical protein
VALSEQTSRLLNRVIGRRATSALETDLAGGGGGGGLVIGAWEDLAIPVDFWLPDNTPFVVEPVAVPIEAELQYGTGANANGGFGIIGTDNGESYAFDFNTYGDTTVNVALRTLIPAGVRWQVQVVGSMANPGATLAVASQLRRRTLA